MYTYTRAYSIRTRLGNMNQNQGASNNSERQLKPTNRMNQ